MYWYIGIVYFSYSQNKRALERPKKRLRMNTLQKGESWRTGLCPDSQGGQVYFYLTAVQLTEEKAAPACVGDIHRRKQGMCVCMHVFVCMGVGVCTCGQSVLPFMGVFCCFRYRQWSRQ